MQHPILVDVHKKNGKRPKFDIYIGRAVTGTEFTEDSKWCNRCKNLKEYELHIKNSPELLNSLGELTGMIIGCWCIKTHKIYPLICHGQILIKLWFEKFLKR